jgi:hypothetical protein
MSSFTNGHEKTKRLPRIRQKAFFNAFVLAPSLGSPDQNDSMFTGEPDFYGKGNEDGLARRPAPTKVNI